MGEECAGGGRRIVSGGRLGVNVNSLKGED